MSQHTAPPPDAPQPIPPGRRTVEQIAAEAMPLEGAARVPFVAGLIESGDWELHAFALRKALGDAWGLADRTVRDYATRARFAALADPAQREAIAARLFTGFEIAEEHAYGDESKAAGARAAIAALVEQRAMLGLTTPALALASSGATGDGAAPDPASVPLREGLTCGACDRSTYADPLPRFCGHCGSPLELLDVPEPGGGASS